jgi:prepilin-type processing-associated H-X9-DG protein
MLSLLVPSATFAQALADRIPADAVVYIGWKGADTLGPEYDNSHLKAVSSASEIRQVFSVALPLLVTRFGELNPQPPAMQQAIQQTLDLMKVVWSRPTALYFSDLNPSKPDGTKIALLIDAGSDADLVSQHIKEIIAQPGPAIGLPISCRVSGTMVIVSTFDYPDKIDKPLSADAEFQRVLAPLTKDPVGVFYMDDTAAVSLAQRIIRENAPADALRLMPLIIRTGGLDGLKHVAFTDGFDGRNWVTQGFVDAPAPRHGFLASGDGALSDELFRLIPETAARFSASHLDLDSLYGLVLTAVETFTDDAGASFHKSISDANDTLGIDLEKDFIAAFGTEWAWYIDPTTTGFGGLGGVMVNRAHDPVKLEMALDHIETALNNRMKQNPGGDFVKLEFRHEVVDGVRLHFMAIPVISPSWAVKDGVFYFGLYPQSVASALDRPADSKSVLTNPTFLKIRPELGGPDKVSGLAFNDLPQTAQAGYQTLLLISQLYLGIGDLFGAQFPALIIPPLNRITPELEPSGLVMWTDDAGWHSKQKTPFPGADLLGSLSFGNIVMGETAITASILLPSLGQPRGAANVVKSANNMRQIGLAITLYAGDNKGKYPPDLGTLVKTEDIAAQVFISPSNDLAVPPNMTPDQTAAWVNTNSDYVFSGVGLTNAADAGRIIAYEKNDFFNNGKNILFADGHVEFIGEPEAQKQIDAIPKAAGK